MDSHYVFSTFFFVQDFIKVNIDFKYLLCARNDWYRELFTFIFAIRTVKLKKNIGNKKGIIIIRTTYIYRLRFNQKYETICLWYESASMTWKKVRKYEFFELNLYAKIYKTIYIRYNRRKEEPNIIPERKNEPLYKH